MATERTGRAQAILLNWVPSILFNVVLPFVTYSVLTGHGMHTAPALAVAGGWPVVELAVFFAIHRRVDEFSVLSLVYLALSVVAAVAFTSTRLVLVKDSAITGLLALVILGSMVLPRPLMFYFGRKFATDGTPAGVAWWNGLWRYPGFRRTQRVINLVWGGAFLAESLTRIGLTYVVSTSAMVLVNAVLPLAVVAGLVSWTVVYGRRARAAAGHRADAVVVPTPS
jgi:intracellular septation protein A